MLYRTLLLFMVGGFSLGLAAAPTANADDGTGNGEGYLQMEIAPHLEWWTNDRFGMFIHWGLYSMRATREWISDADRNAEDYGEYYRDRYFTRWNPDLFEPEKWAKAAKAAGIKYFVITTKHHEGFCLWDSQYTDYKVTNTPYGKDLIGPMVEAFRNEGIRIGFYYSIMDWYHPDFPVRKADDMAHPKAKDEEFRKAASQRDLNKYAAYVKNQVRELLTNFGRIDVLWFDYSFPETDRRYAKELLDLVRGLQPHVIMNERLAWWELEGSTDLASPEGFHPRGWVMVGGKRVPWETCTYSSGFWGYYPNDHDWKTPEQLIRILVDTVSKGGNLLINFGPTGRGELDENSLEAMEQIGEWMRRHGRAIYGCTEAPAEYKTPQDCRLTYNPATNRLYVHIFAWPTNELHIDGLGGKVSYGQFLHDASELSLKAVAWRSFWETLPEDVLTISLPTEKPDVAVPVIELYLK